MRKLLFIVIISGIFMSCDKGEIAIEKRTSGDVVTSTVNMSSDYQYQVYFDLETNQVVGQNAKIDWDLGFHTEGEFVTLNSATYMGVWNTGQTDFNAVTSDAGAVWQYDTPTGNTDSTAFGLDWKTNPNTVYVVDRGYTSSGALRGKFKCQILSADATGYQLKAANLDGSNEQVITIAKDENVNRVNYHFDTHTVHSFEPHKEIWDLCFTQFTYIYPDHTSYLVTGVMQNRHNMEVALVRDVTFEDIQIADTLEGDFKSYENTIGYEWKFYSFDTESFVLLENYSYIIKTFEDRYYKLRFIDFYDEGGVKGNPKFEFQEL